MKRLLIGALVGAILVFGWQAVGHMMLSYHDDAYKQVPEEQNVMSTLTSALKEEGQYMIPGINPNATPEEEQAQMEQGVGKPWALIQYHPVATNDMGMRALRSFTTAFLSVLIFIWLLGKNPGDFGTVLLKALAVGLLMFVFVWYNQNIWMETPWGVIKGELIDLLVAWGLCGVWLGWWLNRKRRSY